MTEAKEVLKYEPPVLVALLGNRLGHEIKKPGVSFTLSNVYDHEPMAGNDVFTQVYFRTESGNIYRLDDKRRLIDAEESQRRGAVAQTSLDLEELKGQKLTIGEPFSYGSTGKKGNTSKVTEIVPVVEHRTYIPDALRQITNGRINTIKEDFQKMLPPQKIGARNNRELEGLVGPEDLEELKRIRTGNLPKAEKKPQATPPPTIRLTREMTQIKGNETPNVNAPPTKPEARNVQDKNLEQKASELAKATKEQGMGQLHGKFPWGFLEKLGRGSDAGGFTETGDFIKGEEIPTGDRATLMITRKTPVTLMQRREHENRHVWVVNHYVPPMEYAIVRGESTETKEKHFLGLRTKTIIVQGKLVKKESNNPMNYHGKKGEHDWRQYDYYMPIDNRYDNSRYENARSGRQGTFVNMSIAVPPDIAAQIDEQVEKNVYFPDAFFQALYPELPVGTNIYDHLKRMPATELEIADLRNVPDNLRRLYYDVNQGQKSLFKGVVRKYPQPIPY